MADQAAPLTILRRKQVEARTGLSRSTIYAKFRENPKRPREFDPTFPRPVSIGKKAVGWVESEVDAWLAEQIRKSRQDPAPAHSPVKRPKARALSLPAPVAILDGEWPMHVLTTPDRPRTGDCAQDPDPADGGAHHV